MANFPTWINKNNKSNTMNNNNNNNSNLSPRQVANKAYSLAIKKLDKDDKRRRPQYTVRERLLLSNTMTRAEDLLNKRTNRFNRRVLAIENEDEVAPPAKKMTLVKKEESMLVKEEIVLATETTPVKKEETTPVKKEETTPVTKEETTPVTKEETTPVQKEETTPVQKEETTPVKKEEMVTPLPSLQIKHESPLPTMKNTITPQQMAVSLAVVAVAAYSSLSIADQKALLSSSRDYCRPIMIPNHSTMTALTTMI